MTTRTRSLGLLLGAMASLTAPSCGYHLRGHGTFLPERIRVIGIPPFETIIPRRELAQRLTQEVTSVFISRGGYRSVPGGEGADALLTGTITGFLVTPVEFDASGRATRGRLSITASVKLEDRREGGVLYDRPSFEYGTNLELGGGAADLFEPESSAIDRIARDFARTLVAEIVEGF